MSDQPATLAILDQFFRSFARPELDRMAEERMEESRERSRRMYVRSIAGSLDFLEKMYAFLHYDIRHLEQQLDEIHVLIDRSDSRGLPDRLERARDRYEDALATRTRLEGYLPDVEESIERIDDCRANSLRAQIRDLRRRVNDLATPLGIAGWRLARYAQWMTAPAP